VKFRLNNTHPVFGFRMNGGLKVEVLPAPDTALGASYIIAPPAGMSPSAVGQMIDDAIAKDNDRDGAAYEEKIPNLINIYRTSKL